MSGYFYYFCVLILKKMFLMKKLFLFGILGVLLCFGSTPINAQKLGFLNSRNLLVEMPEVAKSDSILVLYQKQLSIQGDSMGKAFQEEYKAFTVAYQGGTLPAVKLEKTKEDLQKKQAALQAFAKDSEQKMAILRKQLLQPILSKMDKAIQAIGKDGQYSMIFDTSVGDTLYAQEGIDISPMVRQKLGLKEPVAKGK